MVLTFAALLVGCQPDESAVDGLARGDCNPVESSHCLLPYPSEFYLDESDASATGFQLAFGPTSLPTNVDGLGFDPKDHNRRDGFPILGTLYAHLPDATLQGVIGHQALEAYANPDALTVIVDAETGAWMPHFVEREAGAIGTGRDLLMLRPVAPWEHGHRYVVGIRGLVDEGGTLVAAPAGFAALRDGEGDRGADLERQRAHYEDVVFPTLEQSGFGRSALQLAWSLVTISAESSLGEALWIRDDVLERIAQDGLRYEIDEVVEGDCSAADPPDIARDIEGTMHAPLYLTAAEPGSLLARDEEGSPVYNGTAEVSFTVLVPCSVMAAPGTGKLLQYGHGIFGTRDEVRADYLAKLAQDNGWVVFATDWTGLALDDSPFIALMLVKDPGNFSMVPERTLQGFVEALSAAELITGSLAEDPWLSVGGVPLIDTSSVWFYGNSAGGILGGAYTALSQRIQRVVLGTPGMPWSFLVTRANGFEGLLALLEVMYEDWADVSLLMGSLQVLWDVGGPGGYAWFTTQQQLDEETPNKEVLIQTAIGDASVPTLGAHIMARAYGARLIEPPVREVWGLDVAEAPFEGSALQELDFGLGEPIESVPADPTTDPHDLPRVSPEAQAQLVTFFEQAVVTHTCDGPCDPD
jgi:hypothetical protein